MVRKSSSQDRRPARERLLAAADELFYEEGVNLVGIDRVIERAGVAKASLYDCFGSKEKLIPSLLRPVLHYAIAEGPILTARVDQIDPHIFLSHPSLCVDLLGDLMEEFFLHLCGSPGHPGDLDDDEIAGVAQTEISLFRINYLVALMTVDDLKFVMRRDIGDIYHRLVDGFAHHSDQFERCIPVDVYSG
jgi:AcrR family transcriptional regulator